VGTNHSSAWPARLEILQARSHLTAVFPVAFVFTKFSAAVLIKSRASGGDPSGNFSKVPKMPTDLERQKIPLAALAEIIESEFNKTLGRSCASYMPRVGFRARDGEPNWDVDIGLAPPEVLSAFLGAIDVVKTTFDLDERSHRRLPKFASPG
jgi:hypothetical protein